MFARLVLAAAVTGLLVAPWVAADDPPKKPAPAKDRVADLLQKLHHQTVSFDANPSDVPVFELLQALGKKHDITFVVREKAFRDDGVENVREAKANLTATRLDGFTLHQFLTVTLADLNATYLVRTNCVEVVPLNVAAKEAKVPADEDGEYRLKHPLVSAVYRERPLNEAVAELADLYELNVVVAPQAGDNRSGFVSARLLNVPADEALELLAVQADLRLVRKGNAYLITSPGHADGLFSEALDKERAKAELQRLKITPLPPPGADK